MANQTKKGAKARPKADACERSTSRMIAVGIITASVVVLIVYMMTSTNTGTGQVEDTSRTPGATAPLAPPLTGTEVKTISSEQPVNAKTSTFKMEEISGPDCLAEICDKLSKLKGVYKVTADYSNTLCAVEYDSSRVNEFKIIKAFDDANHPGKLTSDTIKTQ